MTKKLKIVAIILSGMILIGSSVLWWAWPRYIVPAKVAIATANTAQQTVTDFDKFLANLMIYQHFKDFQEEQYFMSAQFQLPEFLGNSSSFDLYSDFGNKKLKFVLDIGGHNSSFLVSDQYITLETSALSQIYGADLASFAKDWNDAFFSFEDIPEDTDFNIFQANLHLPEQIYPLFSQHFTPLVEHIQIKKMDDRQLQFPSESLLLPTYSVHIPSENMAMAVRAFVEDLLNDALLLEDLLYYIQNIGSNLEEEYAELTLEQFKVMIAQSRDEFIAFYESTSEGDFSLSLKDGLVAQITFSQGNQLKFLRFDEPEKPLQMITIHQQYGSEIETVNLSLTDEKIFLERFVGNNIIFSFIYMPKEIQNNLRISDGISTISLFSIDAPTAQNVSITFEDEKTGFTSEKQVFPAQWFPQTESFQPVFELGLFDFMKIMGELSL